MTYDLQSVDSTNRGRRDAPAARVRDVLLKRLLPAALIAGLNTVLGIIWLHMRQARSVVPVHVYNLESEKLAEWTPIGGRWRINDGTIRNDSFERGAKLLTGSPDWRDYTLTADMLFAGMNADMGLSVRVLHEKPGVDNYDGYYIGVRTLDGTMVVGRSHFGWAESQPVAVLGGVNPFTWYRMTVTAVGCHIAASVQNLKTMQTTWMAFEETLCVDHGRFGLRSLNAGSTWRNISIAPAGQSDYLALRQHATKVERPDFPPGPPWLTPVHVGMLFVGVLVAALLTQLAYFRMQHWKTNMIVHERERLAHQIHDTMAQSFAGIGYQIQGIRRGIMRSSGLDTERVAAQLNTAYLLVRSCHEEASRTIAMLGSSPPQLQQDVMGALEDTARKIAGDEISIVARTHGRPARLNLRLVDALLQIGREAITNAVHHSDPSVISIDLTYGTDVVELVIADDGKGFEYSRQTEGFGILGIQRHARDVAGTLQITSAPGCGTSVRISAKVLHLSFVKHVAAMVKHLLRTRPNSAAR